MRRIILFTVVIALALTAAAAADEQQSLRPNALFRWGQPWGTWVWRTYVGPGLTLPALITFHSDGTITGSDATMFGGVPGAETKTTPIHGVWERTGRQSIGGTGLYLIFDSASGVLIAMGRSRSSLQFATGFESFQGKMFVETLACATGPLTCPNPLDPNAQWVAFPGMPQDGFEVSGALLARVPAGPLH